MLRQFLGALGVLTTLVPDRIVDVFEAIAVENPEENTVHSWFSPLIRVEGVVIALAALRGGRLYAWLMNISGIFGAVLLFLPRLYEQIAGPLVYEDPESVKWNEHLTGGVRVIGAVYVLLALLDRRRRHES
ncbi:hypothetical protein C463_12217 [Halorubrum californiense DSM 19288]|uniref:Uncharacterized protein n=1 Tax=Halorubrum californiense DSM 19288 TaxID=1227465 RepID=M0E0W5_9EURY|nr:hypothetical protein [Halorubrum californiense]ELZ41445.1 hypothetical protein C463_12217 [Halorubrum californiense DSM 19288]